MAVTLTILRIARAVSGAAADAQTLEDSRLVFDGTRIRAHDGATAGGKKCLMAGEGGSAPDYAALSLSAAADSTFTWPSAAIQSLRYVTINAGAGAFVSNLILPTTYGGAALPAGTQCTVIIQFVPAVANYHVDIYSAATANPKLMRASSNADGQSAAQVTLVFNGTAWLAGPLIYST